VKERNDVFKAIVALVLIAGAYVLGSRGVTPELETMGTSNFTSDINDFSGVIQVDTINEHTSANGVTIDSVTLKDGAISSSSGLNATTGDITIEAETGSVTVKGDEAAADAVFIDANDAVTTGVDIDVGSVSGLTIDGGLTDIGGGSCSVADGDNDLCVAGVVEIDDELELDGALDADSTANIAGATTLGSSLTVGGLLYPSFADETITDGETLTPTVTVYALDSAGAVTMTLAASGTEGQLLILIGDDANDITIADTNIRTNDGNAQVLNQYDVLMLVYQDSEWIEISNSDNS
jgi:hypothetical protein